MYKYKYKYNIKTSKQFKNLFLKLFKCKQKHEFKKGILDNESRIKVYRILKLFTKKLFVGTEYLFS